MFPSKQERAVLTDLHSTLQEKEPKFFINWEFKPEGFFAIVKNQKGTIIHNINVMEWEDDAQAQIQAYQMKLAMDVSFLKHEVA